LASTIAEPEPPLNEASECLLPRLVQLYDPPRDVAPHEPSLAIQNSLYTHVLSQDLEKAGIRSFSGVSNGKVTWIVPLNQHVYAPAAPSDRETVSREVFNMNMYTDASPGERIPG